ncbi:MAG TPA: hypothetical protein DGH68_09520, partial [Bacteroidetes bacterium]|nr:hypothetical protein [Bacteroidota bacterium]
MHYRLFHVVVMVTVLSVSGRSEWVSLRNGTSQPTPPLVTVLQDDPSGTLLKVEVSGFEVRQILSEGKSYQSIDLLTEIATSLVGSPQVPYLAQMLAIPDR